MALPAQDSLTAAGAPWSPFVALWMFACVSIGTALWHRFGRRTRVEPSKFALNWRHADERPAVAIIVAVVALCGWASWTTALSGDEASNIEPHFWRNWYLAWESRSSPPLFRTVIHMLSGMPYRFAMRAPALAAGTGALVLFYVMLRRRTSAHVAQWLLAAVAGSALMLGYCSEQKSYTLWLLLLLACHRCIASALRGRRSMWAGFSLFAGLALLTHYLSAAWLVGYVLWSLRVSREDLKDIILALLPGALAVAPMALPVLSLDESVSEGPGAKALASWLQASIPAALVPGGILASSLLFLLRPVEHVRGTQIADGALPWLIGAGTFGTFLAATGGAVEARFLMPLLPMAALAAAGRMPRPIRDWNRSDRAILAIVAVISIATGLARIGPLAIASATNPVAVALEDVAKSSPPPLRLVHPPWTLHVALFEASGRRDLLHDAHGDDLLRLKVKFDGVWWGSLRERPSVQAYDKVAATYEEFELWSLAGPNEAEQLPPIDLWGGYCKQTVRIGNPHRSVPGPWAHVWRCQRTPPPKPAKKAKIRGKSGGGSSVDPAENPR